MFFVLRVLEHCVFGGTEDRSLARAIVHLECCSEGLSIYGFWVT